MLSNVNPQVGEILSAIYSNKELECLKLSSELSPEILTERLKHGCAISRNWLESNFQEWYAGYLVRHPFYGLKLFAVSLMGGNSPYSMYGGSVSILPSFANDVFFGERNYANRNNLGSAQEIQLNTLKVNSPLILWIVLFMCAQLIARSKHRNLDKSPNKGLADYSILLVPYGLILIAVSAVSIPNEWFRQSIVGQLLVLVGSILALDRALQK